MSTATYKPHQAQQIEERARRSEEKASAIEQRFADWLAGFIDGEGCFLITRNHGGYSCAFRLGVRADDRPILDEIVQRTGLGSVSENRGMARWIVGSREDTLGLVLLLERAPLRAKKRRDAAIWSEAVRLRVKMVNRGKGFGGGSYLRDWSEIGALREQLIAGRRFQG